MDEYQKTHEYQKKISEYIKKVDFSSKKRVCLSKTELELIRKLRENYSLQGVFSLILFSIINDGDYSVGYLFNSIVKQRKFNLLLQSAILYTEIKTTSSNGIRCISIFNLNHICCIIKI